MCLSTRSSQVEPSFPRIDLTIAGRLRSTCQYDEQRETAASAMIMTRGLPMSARMPSSSHRWAVWARTKAHLGAYRLIVDLFNDIPALQPALICGRVWHHLRVQRAAAVHTSSGEHPVWGRAGPAPPGSARRTLLPGELLPASGGSGQAPARRGSTRPAGAAAGRTRRWSQSSSAYVPSTGWTEMCGGPLYAERESPPKE